MINSSKYCSRVRHTKLTSHVWSAHFLKCPLFKQRPILTLFDPAGCSQISSFSWLLLLADSWHKEHRLNQTHFLPWGATTCLHSIVCWNYTVGTPVCSGISPGLSKRDITWTQVDDLLWHSFLPQCSFQLTGWDKKKKRESVWSRQEISNSASSWGIKKIFVAIDSRAISSGSEVIWWLLGKVVQDSFRLHL